jgi:hypothetical protein
MAFRSDGFGQSEGSVANSGRAEDSGCLAAKATFPSALDEGLDMLPEWILPLIAEN